MAENITWLVNSSAVPTETVIDNTTMTTMESGTETSEPYRFISDLVFHSLIIAIGLIGFVSNCFVLFMLIASQQVKKHAVNILFINQMSFDIFSCFWLVVTYAVKMSNSVYISGVGGYLLCITIVNETLQYFGLVGGLYNLTVIAVERHLKIVHPFWHKKHVRKWMIYAVIAAIWIFTIFYNFIISITTTTIYDGVCYSYTYFVTQAARYALATHFGKHFLSSLLIFCICYGRIFLAVRRQARVFAANQKNVNSGSVKATKGTNTRIQMNAIKTMLLISLSFLIFWCPFYVVNMMSVIAPERYNVDVYYAILLFSFANLCTNPYIYATNLDAVRQYILKRIPCGSKITSSEGVTAATASI